MRTLIFITALLSSFWCYGQNKKSLALDSLPSKVRESLQKKYNGYSISSITSDELSGSGLAYNLKATKERSKYGESTVTIYDLTFNSEGKLLSRTKNKHIFYTNSPMPKEPPSHSKDDGHNH